jgi:ATP-binding cassette subfamily F protein 3
MVPAVRNILGGFLFSGDDVYKRVGVLSGGERTRLAVARMLLRSSNTLVLDEPTNHLDLDSKDVLLDALVDYGGTLIFVSHDRYFVERLATKVIEVGSGQALVYPGTYKEFLWHKEHRAAQPKEAPSRPQDVSRKKAVASDDPPKAHVPARQSHEDKKKADAETRRRQRAEQARRERIESLEARIAEAEQAIRDLEQAMAAPGFYEDRVAAQPLIDRHQTLMWQVGDLMHQWEELQNAPELAPASDR